MVQEKSGIDICGEVHLEQEPVLFDCCDNGLGICLLMLGAVRPLCPEGVDHVGGIQVQHPGADVQAALTHLVTHGILAVIGDLGVAAVEVHCDRIAGEISVIDTETVRSLLQKIVAQSLRVVLQNLSEILVHVVHFYAFTFPQGIVYYNKEKRKTDGGSSWIRSWMMRAALSWKI